MAYHHGQLQRALLDAALAMIEEGGPAALSLRGAARRAGVSVAAPYRHFADKEALLAALAHEGFARLVERLEAADGTNPVERLLEIGVAYVAFAAAHPAHYRLMFGHAIRDRSAHPDLDRAAGRAYEILGAACQAIDDVGRLRGSVGSATLLSWSVTHGLASLILDGQARIPTDEATVVGLSTQLGQLLLDGVVLPADP